MCSIVHLLAMGAFTIQNAYLDANDVLVDRSNKIWHRSKRFIEVWAERNEFGEGATRVGGCHYCCSRDSTAEMEMVLGDHSWRARHRLIFDWTGCCGIARKDPQEVLKSWSIPILMVYLIWCHEPHLCVRRLNAYESIWKALGQLCCSRCLANSCLIFKRLNWQSFLQQQHYGRNISPVTAI